MTSAPPIPLREPAVRVSKVGYIGLASPDVEALAGYYRDLLDFHCVASSPQEAYFTTTSDHHSVMIKQGERKARAVVGYEVFEELPDAQRRLREAGYDVERRSDIGPGTPDVLVLAEPGTDAELHLVQRQDPSGLGGFTPLRPTKLGHIAAFTDDFATTQSFYQEILGFKWSDTLGDFFVFLRCNADHHAANFMASSKRAGLHHVAYEMRDPNHLIAMLDHLGKNGYRLHWGPGRHGPGHNLFTYHRDPDGNTVELFTQIDTVVDELHGTWEPRPWHETYPMGPRTWEVDAASANIWGPVNFEELDH